MVKYNSMLQYQVFHRIIKEDTIEGKNHWLFMDNTDMFAEYQHLNLMSEQELDDFSADITYLSDYLNEKGAYLGYAAMMNRIAEDFPQVNVLKVSDYNISEVEKIAKLYGYQYPCTEVSLKPVISYITELGKTNNIFKVE